MNADQRILQILENSACLSKGQLLGYLKHTLYPEELRAVELHLSTCALCNDALEGMELQQDPDKLLASLVPPVLPAVVLPKEKPKEKKEAVVTPKQEKTTAPATKPAQTAPTPVDNGNVQRYQPRNLWLKPLGIAAAVALGFGALWFFEFRKKEEPHPLASQTADTNNNAIARSADTVGPHTAAAPPVDEAKLLAERKHKDSLLLAKKEEARHKARKDSIALLAAQKASAEQEKATQGLLAKQTENEKESTAVADVATRKAMAAPAMARSKEDAPKESKEDKDGKDSKDTKKVMTDYELGMQKYKEKNYASALLYFKSAESDKGDPKHWEAVYYSALCNKNLDKKRKAIKLFERVIDANAPQKKAAQKQLDELKKKE